MSKGAGKCGWKGCNEQRHQFSTGRYAAYCLVHHRKTVRTAYQSTRKAFIAVPALPVHVHIVQRRCLRCGRKCPSLPPFFDTSKDTPRRLYMVCGLCDGSAEKAGMAGLFPPLEVTAGSASA